MAKDHNDPPDQRPPRDLDVPYRFPLLLLGFIALGAGLMAGLSRIGWEAPFASRALAAWHAPLMICAFFGALIALERAVATGRAWAYAAPLSAGLGGILLISGLSRQAAITLFIVASLVFTIATFRLARRHPGLPMSILTLGAISWLGGNLMWLAQRPLHEAVPWWAGFLILTIAGERLELSRLRPASERAKRLFAAAVALFMAALLLGLIREQAGHVLMAAACAGLVLWLLRHDIALSMVRDKGLTRFIAVSLLAGYFWLGVAAIAGLAGHGMFAPGPNYDLTIHAVFLGFVFSMVFGHAPIIFPAVTRFTLAWHPLFYLHLALLHISLVVRLFAGPELHMPGGALNAAAIILFVLNTVAAVIRGRISEHAR